MYINKLSELGKICLRDLPIRHMHPHMFLDIIFVLLQFLLVTEPFRRYSVPH